MQIKKEDRKSLTSTLIFASIGFVILIAGLYFYYKDSEVLRNWKEIQGEITKSELTQIQRIGRGSPSYTADIEYRYNYQNKDYVSMCCDSGSGDYERWKEIVDKNPVETSADILIDPNDPSKSILKDSIQPLNVLNLVLIVAGAIGIIIGLFSTYMVLKSK